MAKNDHHKLGISTIPQGDRGRCKNQTVSWGKLRKKLIDPQVDKSMSHSHYLTLNPDGRNKAKDVGSYVLGQFDNNIRKKENIKFRTGVALDIDHPSAENISWLENGISDVCEYEFLAVTTRSHTVTQQKWRVIFPTLKPIPADHYSAVSRILSSKLFKTVEESMEATDDVSHRVAQIMYLSSVSKDGRFENFHNEGEILDHEALLAAYPGWEDWTKLPYAESRGNARPGGSVPAEAPTEKTGLVGAFCRAYSIEEAMEKFLPGVYVKPRRASGGQVRYTYSKGSGSNGAIVYPDGHLYSQHGTDPCSERNVNAFDLVRLHLFGARDKADDAGGDLQMSRQPSFKAMREKLASDPKTQRQAARIRDEQIDAQFDSLDSLDDAPDTADAFDNLSAPPRTGDPLLDDGDDEAPAVLHVNGHAYLNNLDAESLALLGEEPAPARPGVIVDDILGDTEDGDEDGTAEGGVPNYVKFFNEKCSLALHKGKTMIIYDNEEGIDFGSTEDFLKYYRYINKVNDNGTKVYLGQEWIDHPKHKMYPKGVVFNPTYKGTASFNMWKGFSLKPKPEASCELILKHIREILCCGNHAYSEYLINYLAHLVQRPEEKPGVALIFRGKKGSGKDTLGQYVGKMMKKHYVVIGSSEQLFQKHNPHLQYAIFVHLEEAIWAGDKGNDSRLKYMITSPTQLVEPKFVNTFEVDSFYRILMTSNAEWVVPASFDERRYFVLDVSSAKAQQPTYFDPLRAEMFGDGPAALLAFLQARDIRTFQVTQVPQTDALQAQKEHGLTDVNQWWFECLMDGLIPGEDGFSSNINWHTEAAKAGPDSAFANYARWVERRPRDRYGAANKIQFGKRLKQIAPGIVNRSHRDKEESNRFVQVYVFPILSACRADFTRITGISPEWPDQNVNLETETSDGFEML